MKKINPTIMNFKFGRNYFIFGRTKGGWRKMDLALNSKEIGSSFTNDTIGD